MGWVSRFEDIVAGREGQYRVRLAKNHKNGDCAYPGAEVLPDGTFVATTYSPWTPGEEPYILSVRFTLSELDAKRARGRSSHATNRTRTTWPLPEPPARKS